MGGAMPSLLPTPKCWRTWQNCNCMRRSNATHPMPTPILCFAHCLLLNGTLWCSVGSATISPSLAPHPFGRLMRVLLYLAIIPTTHMHTCANNPQVVTRSIPILFVEPTVPPSSGGNLVYPHDTP